MGAIIPLQRNDEYVYRMTLWLLKNGDYQGGHGCGVAVVYKDGSTEILKDPRNTDDFLIRYYREIKEMIEDPLLVIIHNRLVSAGKQDYVNTQPVETNAIILAHNGTIYELSREKKISDTVLLAANITGMLPKRPEKERVLRILKEYLHKLTGTANLLIYDKGTREFYVLKDSAMDLVYDVDNKAIIAASDASRMISDPGKEMKVKAKKSKVYLGFFRIEEAQEVTILPEDKSIRLGSIAKADTFRDTCYLIDLSRPKKIRIKRTKVDVPGTGYGVGVEYTYVSRKKDPWRW